MKLMNQQYDCEIIFCRDNIHKIRKHLFHYIDNFIVFELFKFEISDVFLHCEPLSISSTCNIPMSLQARAINRPQKQEKGAVMFPSENFENLTPTKPNLTPKKSTKDTTKLESKSFSPAQNIIFLLSKRYTTET